MEQAFDAGEPTASARTARSVGLDRWTPPFAGDDWLAVDDQVDDAVLDLLAGDDDRFQQLGMLGILCDLRGEAGWPSRAAATLPASQR